MIPTVSKFHNFLQVALLSLGTGPKQRRNLGMFASACSSVIALAISFIFFFRCAGSSLLHRLFSSCGREQGVLLGCGAPASHCDGFSCCVGAQGFRAPWLQQLGHVGSVVVALRLQTTGSIIVAHGLSCSVAYGIFLEQGSNSCLLHWQEDSLPLSHQGSPLSYSYEA